MRKTPAVSKLIHAGLILSALLMPWHSGNAEGTKLEILAVLPFEIEDNSGEIDPPDRHQFMLAALTEAISRELSGAQLYAIVPHESVTAAIAAVNPGTYLHNCNGCEIDIAKRTGAQRVLVGWIFKMSTLIGTLHIDIKDVTTGRTVYSRAFDFRGDDQRAWDRAAKVFAEELKGSS
jgi:Protein of unknown function (DUF2380)